MNKLHHSLESEYSIREEYSFIHWWLGLNDEIGWLNGLYYMRNSASFQVVRTMLRRLCNFYFFAFIEEQCTHEFDEYAGTTYMYDIPHKLEFYKLEI